MKIAVSALGPTLDDRVDARFGRAAYLVIVDSDSGSFDALDNRDSQQALEGAGIASAERIAAQGVGALITGHLGPKAYRALAAAGVKGYDGSGNTVREALEALKSGKLPVLEEGSARGGRA